MSTSAPSRARWSIGAGPERPRPQAMPGVLPALYLITPQPGASDARFVRELGAALDGLGGDVLVQFRAHGLSPQRWLGLARDVLRTCRQRDVALLLGGGAGVDELLAVGADGLHMPSRVLMACDRRAVPANMLLGASCHDVEQLRRAGRLGVDLVTLSPVLATESHPGAPTLGWSGLGAMCERAAPSVYALGGLGPQHVERARAVGAHGVAGMRALWSAGRSRG